MTRAITPPGQEGWLRQEENIAKQPCGADGVVDQDPTKLQLPAIQFSLNKMV
jgi:hypothetical protein